MDFLKNNLKTLSIVFLFVLTILSCRRTELSWNTALLSPLLTSSLSFKDIVRDSILSVDSNQTLQFVFDKNFVFYLLYFVGAIGQLQWKDAGYILLYWQ